MDNKESLLPCAWKLDMYYQNCQEKKRNYADLIMVLLQIGQFLLQSFDLQLKVSSGQAEVINHFPKTEKVFFYSKSQSLFSFKPLIQRKSELSKKSYV